MYKTKEQFNWMLNELTSYKRGIESMQMENDILKNALTGIARMMKISPEDFAKAMIGGKNNEDYEKDVLLAFTKITGRTTNDLDGVVAQEIKKDKKK